MNLLHRHYQNKKFKSNGASSICEIQLYEYDNLIHYISDFTFDYFRCGDKNQLTIHHGFTLNLKNGDIQTYYQLSNYEISEKINARSKNKRTKNNFSSIFNLIENSIYKGEKRRNYWGVRYNKSVDKITNILISKIKPHIQDKFFQDKEYSKKYVVSPIFDLFVDFHLHKKNIKGHDSVYNTIQYEYPKSKWLRQNENKFLPAVLDSYGIKSKYLIGVINQRPEIELNIRSVSYLCNLFGENYVDYLRKMNWIDTILDGGVTPKNHHSLRNDSEKTAMINLINDWNNGDAVIRDNFIDVINKVLSLRDFLEKKNIDIKFNTHTSDDVELLLKKLENLKNHFKKGYKIRYKYPEHFVNEIESDINDGDNVFKVTVLKTEEDFFTEGYIMKNCMGKQFNRAVIYTYISMRHNKIRINLEYKNGILITCFGKANTQVDTVFNEAVSQLSNRMMRHSTVTWTKEKYDFL